MNFKYKKKPVVVEAFKLSKEFWEMKPNMRGVPDWAELSIITGTIVKGSDDETIIKTLEDGKQNQAKHVASSGDFIIRGVKGELYPCKPDIFEDTYEKVQ